MRSRSNLPVFLGYVVLCLLVAGFLGAQMGGEFMLGGYRVHAVFKTGADLVAGDDVTMAGLRVGKVESLSPSSDSTQVVLLMHKDFAPLFRDARAVVRQKNLLGEAYIEVNRGQPSTGAIADGGVIDEQHTLTPVEVDQVLNALDPQVRDRLAIVINSLGQGIAGRGADMNAAAADLQTVAVDLQTIAHSLASNSDHLDSLIADLAKIIETLAAWHSDFKAMIADWDKVMQTLASREQALQGTFTEQDRVLAIFDQALSNGAAEGLNRAIAQAPSTLDRASHYLDAGTRVFGVVRNDTPGIAHLFDELASVMSGIGIADEPGVDKGKTVHMWRVFCPGQCFGPQLP